jgi:hypothetical protein
MTQLLAARIGGQVGRVMGATVAAVLIAAVPAAALSIDYTLTGPAGANGWYSGPVVVHWNVTGETMTSGCDSQSLDRDTTGTQVSCTAWAGSAKQTATTEMIHIDQTPPVGVAGAPARPPDVGGWFTAPVLIAWTGTDATSGIASCTVTTYSGPDSTTGTPSGTCTDRAGNVSAPVALPLWFDATPPALSGITASISGPYATIRWLAGSETARVTVVRTAADGTGAPKTLLDGAPGATEVRDDGLVPGTPYVWTVTAADAAGNAATGRATGTLAAVAAQGTSPTTKARTKAPPTLRWRSVSGATYYNIQLFRGTRRVLNAWPGHARYTLPKTWRYGGRTHRLLAGRYAFFVWAGYGSPADHRYGKLLAKGMVKVAANGA